MNKNECKYFKDWRMAYLLNKDGKIVTIDSEKKSSIAFYDHPDACEVCHMNRTCHDEHSLMLTEKSTQIERVWIRDAGKFGIAKTSLFTKIINLRKMSQAVREFIPINGTWKEV
jgi:hypothetical protein